MSWNVENLMWPGSQQSVLAWWLLGSNGVLFDVVSRHEELLTDSWKVM